MTIQEMVIEYNEIERQQQERLRAIFATNKANHVYRLIDFANDVTWTEFKMPAVADDRFFDHLHREITRLE